MIKPIKQRAKQRINSQTVVCWRFGRLGARIRIDRAARYGWHTHTHNIRKFFWTNVHYPYPCTVHIRSPRSGFRRSFFFSCSVWPTISLLCCVLGRQVCEIRLSATFADCAALHNQWLVAESRTCSAPFRCPPRSSNSGSLSSDTASVCCADGPRAKPNERWPWIAPEDRQQFLLLRRLCSGARTAEQAAPGIKRQKAAKHPLSNQIKRIISFSARFPSSRFHFTNERINSLHIPSRTRNVR